MKHFFRYDYNFKMFIITNIVSVFLLFLTISFYKTKGLFLFGLLILMFNIFNTFVLIRKQGITIKKDKVTIVDEMWFTSFKLSDIKYAIFKEIKKEKRSNIYGFFHEFYHPSTYMHKSDYVYNNGMVFKIIFYLKDGTYRDTYFGWMYREKNAKRVAQVHKKLEGFIGSLNEVCKKSTKNH